MVVFFDFSGFFFNCADYTVAESFSAEELAKDVRKLLIKGWQPLGGVVVTTTRDGTSLFSDFRYSQTLVKY